MAVRSTRLGAFSVATAGAGATTTVWTVPADRTHILKDVRLDFSVVPAGGVACTLSVQLAAGVNRVIERIGIGGVLSVRFTECFIVLLEGDQIRFTQPANTTAQGYFSGASLAGDPS